MPNYLYIFNLTIKFDMQIYIDHNLLYSMTKETNPTIIVANDDKKEEPKKEDSAKSDKQNNLFPIFSFGQFII